MGILAFVVVVGRVDAQTTTECMECHGDPELTTEEGGRVRSLYLNGDTFRRSVHGDLECIDCHQDITELPHDERLERVDCGFCHEDAVAEVSRSAHGSELRTRSPDAPTCIQCHGYHDVLAADDLDSRISKKNQPHTCGTCHSDPVIVARNNIPIKDPVAYYEKSIHGKLTLEGNYQAATCSDCHRGHLILSALNAESSIFKKNIPITCRNCHTEEYEAYRISVHYQALEKGAKDAPTCTDCHGEHDILRPENPGARTSGFNVAVEVCSPCHASERLARKYGLTPARVTTYQESYHGLALRGGKPTVANCGSCHGVHDILPSTDPRSYIHPTNLVKTCGKCHPNPGENFARSKIHLVTGVKEARIVQIVRSIYIIFITVVIGFMVLHNGIDFLARVRKIKNERYHGLR